LSPTSIAFAANMKLPFRLYQVLSDNANDVQSPVSCYTKPESFKGAVTQ
jgi:hypothetical protein